jgi:hypothetical protein
MTLRKVRRICQVRDLSVSILTSAQHDFRVTDLDEDSMNKTDFCQEWLA